MFHEIKTGNGAFEVCVAAGNCPMVQIEQDAPRTFDSPKAAYDWCVSGYTDLQGTMRGFSYLNAAFALEDLITLQSHTSATMRP